jgi:hypothetical protein
MMIVTVCPTEPNADETLFTLNFASRVRNVNIGTAHRNINAKNLEEALRVARAEAREAKKKRVQLEESVLDLKRIMKTQTEKLAAQTETKIKTLNEVKRGTEAQLLQLTKTNQDCIAKLKEEKEAKHKALQEMETLQRSVRRAADQLKEMQKEKDKLAAVLKQKETDLLAEKKTELVEKENHVVSRPAVRVPLPPSQMSSLGPPTRRETFSAPPPPTGLTATRGVARRGSLLFSSKGGIVLSGGDRRPSLNLYDVSMDETSRDDHASHRSSTERPVPPSSPAPSSSTPAAPGAAFLSPAKLSAIPTRGRRSEAHRLPDAVPVPAIHNIPDGAVSSTPRSARRESAIHVVGANGNVAGGSIFTASRPSRLLRSQPPDLSTSSSTPGNGSTLQTSTIEETKNGSSLSRIGITARSREALQRHQVFIMCKSIHSNLLWGFSSYHLCSYFVGEDGKIS